VEHFFALFPLHFLDHILHLFILLQLYVILLHDSLDEVDLVFLAMEGEVGPAVRVGLEPLEEFILLDREVLSHQALAGQRELIALVINRLKRPK